jgi:stress response protein YsnF
VTSHDLDTVLGWRGATVIDRDGEKLGTLKELYLDQDDRPAWAAVETGLFGMRQSFVPLEGATAMDNQVRVPFTKDHVKDAPNIDPETQLTEDEEDRLHDHYGARRDDAAPDDRDAPDVRAEAAEDRAEAGEDRAEASEDHAEAARDRAEASEDHVEADEVRGEDDAMTRSEEELVVGTRRKVRGKARLKKYVVTEHVQRTVPVQREEVRVEYEPEDEPPADR